ncbi:MAG: hypothetical protein EAZ24_13885, partial [Burkholderiales bacterium]
LPSRAYVSVNWIKKAARVRRNEIRRGARFEVHAYFTRLDYDSTHEQCVSFELVASYSDFGQS